MGRYHKYCTTVVPNLYVARVLQGACDITLKAQRSHIVSQQVLLCQPAVNFLCYYRCDELKKYINLQLLLSLQQLLLSIFLFNIAQKYNY
jgi:hypothetical protein